MCLCNSLRASGFIHWTTEIWTWLQTSLCWLRSGLCSSTPKWENQFFISAFFTCSCQCDETQQGSIVLGQCLALCCMICTIHFVRDEIYISLHLTVVNRSTLLVLSLRMTHSLPTKEKTAVCSTGPSRKRVQVHRRWTFITTHRRHTTILKHWRVEARRHGDKWLIWLSIAVLKGVPL